MKYQPKQESNLKKFLRMQQKLYVLYGLSDVKHSV